MQSTFYAHSRYIERYGLPTTEADWTDHWFVSHADAARTPFFAWLESVVAPRNIVLRSASQKVLMESMLAGVGIGFMPVFQASELSELHEVIPPRPTWAVPVWLVTHVDLHRTAKVQAISGVLRDAVAELSLVA